MKRHIFIILFFSFFIKSYSQGVFKGNYWKQYRKEFYVGIGPSNFLGELGGKDQIGTDFIQDLELKATRYVINTGYRYFLRRDMALRASLLYAMVSGDDKLTLEPFRNNRNLNFRSPIIEGALIYEYHLVQEKAGTRYRIKGSKSTGSKFGIYGFTGIGGFYFNPQSKYINGQWHDLQPLGTEGQGLPGGPSPYTKIGICLPTGLGFRYLMNSKFRFSVEIGVRKTFSDYIDDVSTVYYNNDAIKASKGEIAAYFADPSVKEEPGAPNDLNNSTRTNEQRGDSKNKDSYMFATFNVNYKIFKTRGFRRIRSRRSVPSF